MCKNASKYLPYSYYCLEHWNAEPTSEQKPEPNLLVGFDSEVDGNQHKHSSLGPQECLYEQP